LRWTLAQGRSGDRGRERRTRGAQDHGADGSQIGQDGPPVYTGRRAVPRQRGRAGGIVTRRGNISRGAVVLWCRQGHDHVMAPEQARRLKHESCCWCRSPIVRIDLKPVPSWQREDVVALIGADVEYVGRLPSLIV